MNSLTVFKTFMYTIYNIFTKLTSNINTLLRLCYKKSYFKINCDAWVESHTVNLNSKIGKKVWIDKWVSILPNVEIGDFTCVNKNVLIESGIIGKFCSIAANVSIGLAEHPVDLISTHVATYGDPMFGLIKTKKNYCQPKKAPIIGNDVWIARGATILRGVSIGDGAIIATNSVVTRNVPNYAIVAGVPAKVIKYRFSEDKISKLEKIQWWNNEDFYSKEFENHNCNVDSFL